MVVVDAFDVWLHHVVVCQPRIAETHIAHGIACLCEVDSGVGDVQVVESGSEAQRVAHGVKHDSSVIYLSFCYAYHPVHLALGGVGRQCVGQHGYVYPCAAEGDEVDVGLFLFYLYASAS